MTRCRHHLGEPKARSFTSSPVTSVLARGLLGCQRLMVFIRRGVPLQGAGSWSARMPTPGMVHGSFRGEAPGSGEILGLAIECIGARPFEKTQVVTRSG